MTTKRRSFGVNDIDLIFEGIETPDGKAPKYKISTKIEDFFFEKGLLIFKFKGNFSVSDTGRI